MKRHHLKKIIKESVKEVLNEQFDPCGESLWMTIFLDGEGLGDITGYFPYTVDEVYEYLTTGTTGNTGTGYYIEGPALCNGNYDIPNACLGMQMNTEESEAELEDGTIITLPGVNNLSDVLANIIPTAGGAFTQNEDGTLEGPLELITNYSIYSQLFDQFDATVCWTTTEGANPPQCISNSDLLSFMYECGDNEVIWGCTDETADNYNPEATSDDGSCGYSGCTMFFATNYEDNFYDPIYVVDDGSCVFENYGCIEEYQNSTYIGSGTGNAWNEGLWLNGFGGYYDDNPVQTNPMYPGSEQYTTTSGCGPITGGGIYTAGNFMSFFLGQDQSGGQNVEGITIYDSMASCQANCGGGEETTYYGCYSEISSIPTYGSILTSFLGDVTSGCGPIVSAEIAGTTYTPAEACDDSDNESDLDFENYCYDSLIACEHACPIDDPCEGINLNVFAQSIGYSDASKFCHDCLFLDGFSEQYPECECCPERRWRCSSNGICVGGMGTVDQFPYETEDECIMAGCGGWDCEDYEGLNGAQQSLICCYCNPEDCTTTVNLPPQFDVFCELNCCPKKEKECKKCCCRPKPQGAYFEDPECLPLTTVYLAPNHPTCECPDDMIECPKKPKKVIRPSSPDKVATPLRERLMKLANIKKKK